MALSSGTVAVGTAALPINGSSSNPIILTISNNDNTDAVYLGGENVVPNGGLLLSKQERITFTLFGGERLYVVATKTGHVVSYIAQSL